MRPAGEAPVPGENRGELCPKKVADMRVNLFFEKPKEEEEEEEEDKVNE